MFKKTINLDKKIYIRIGEEFILSNVIYDKHWIQGKKGRFGIQPVIENKRYYLLPKFYEELKDIFYFSTEVAGKAYLEKIKKQHETEKKSHSNDLLGNRHIPDEGKTIVKKYIQEKTGIDVDSETRVYKEFPTFKDFLKSQDMEKWVSVFVENEPDKNDNINRKMSPIVKKMVASMQYDRYFKLQNSLDYNKSYIQNYVKEMFR